MRLHTLFIAVAALFAMVSASAKVAEAKRAMPPTSNICNKTAHKVYVAMGNYAGRGHRGTSGWTYLKPGQCHKFRDSSFHFRGKRTVTGLSKNTYLGCVKYSKRFSITLRGSQASSKTACAAKGGLLVKFTRVSWKKRSATLNILR